MPEYMSHERDRVEDFERNAPALPSGRGKGGVFLNRNGKSYTVNIRPRRWNDKNKPSQLWKGKIASYGLAQYYADAMFHYCGKSRFHFKNVDFIFPTLECIGISTPERLTTTEQSLKYVESIAGKDFVRQREDFVAKVTSVIESAGFILQGERFLNSREEPAGSTEKIATLTETATAAVAIEEAATSSEEAAMPGDEAVTFKEVTATPAEEEAAGLCSAALCGEEAMAFPAVEAAITEDSDDRADRETPIEEGDIEEDEVALYMTNGLIRGSASSQLTVAGFQLNLETRNPPVPDKLLESVEQSLEPIYRMDDCPVAREEGWNMAIDGLSKPSAMGGTLSSAAGSSTAAVVSTSNVSPNVYIPPTVFEGVSFIPGTNFVLVVPGEHVLSPFIARANSEEKPSMQLATTLHVQAFSVDPPSGCTPLSCQPSVIPVSRRPEVKTVSPMQLCELNYRTSVEKVQVQPSLVPTANRLSGRNGSFARTTVHTTAKSKAQRKNAKRQRIRD
ncbi:hypothetical protein KC19_1G108800 [Ceratodon purpureus]|uniref:Uncharacterized protein n=1 Tax=Ceratodon purpureus TaxID=3225 RepID=A0A8T0J5P1_CERPU|nr:hypothetical protein KC19_1G108800 [Ceratodon purpureus]